MAKDFNEAVSTLDGCELENAWKCLGLGYLGMRDERWRASASLLFGLGSRSYLKRKAQLGDNP